VSSVSVGGVVLGLLSCTRTVQSGRFGNSAGLVGDGD
jgi:hypothetical protein